MAAGSAANAPLIATAAATPERVIRPEWANHTAAAAACGAISATAVTTPGLWARSRAAWSGHESGFRRPAVVVSHDELSRHGVPIVLPVTRTRRGYATHVELDGVLPVDSYAQCELVRAVSADRLIRPVGTLGIAHLAKIESILRRVLCL